MKYLKRFNESVEDIDDEEEEKGGVVEMHLSVPIFSDKWTTFFSCRRSKINDKGIYEKIGVKVSNLFVNKEKSAKK